MFNAPCGVRSSVSERKPRVRTGLLDVLIIPNNRCAYLSKRQKYPSDCFRDTLFWIVREPLTRPPSLAVSASSYPRTLTRTADKDKNATPGIRHSALRRTGGESINPILGIHIGYISQHAGDCFLMTEFSANSFLSRRAVTHCGLNARRCILIRQRRTSAH